MDKEETYYEVLRIPRNASISEIVAAYHSAKAAFSKDSMAMYSLFSDDEAGKVLSKLEEAYVTLSNIEKKREYDRIISGGAPPPPVIPAQILRSSEGVRKQEVSSQEVLASREEETDPELLKPEALSGAFLKNIRVHRSLSLEDVSRITKIPQRFLEAIEEEDFKKLPAKVYVQGFIKNLAALYRLEPDSTARQFVAMMDKKKIGT